jgi:polyhydroxybutyrate depolymerase
MFKLGRTLLVSLTLLVIACEGDDSGTMRGLGPVGGGSDGAVTWDAAVGMGGLDAAFPDASVGTDASVVADASAVADAAPGVDAASDAAMMLDTSVPSEAGALDGAADATPAGDASADAAADATTPVEAGPPGASLARTVSVGGVQRRFLLYIPRSAVKATPAPLVSVHHGFTMTGKIMEEITSWKKIAEREAIVVAFPDGLDQPWNVGENVCDVGALVAAPAEQDDFGFVKAIIASADADQPIKKNAVFVAGFSMGGYFANHVGCKGRDFARAVAAHSGGTYDGTCDGQPVPVLLIHGDADGLIPVACGQAARGYWVSRNGCSAQVTTEQIESGSCEWNQGCPAGREVGMCTMKGMDHGWAGAPTSGPSPWLSAALGLNGNLDFGGGDQYEDAAELMWKFFAKYR